MVRYLFYTIGDLTYQSPLVLLIIDVNNLHTTESQVMGQQSSSCMVFHFVCNIYVFPLETYEFGWGH